MKYKESKITSYIGHSFSDGKIRLTAFYKKRGTMEYLAVEFTDPSDPPKAENQILGYDLDFVRTEFPNYAKKKFNK